MKTVQTITTEDLDALRGQYIVQIDHKHTDTNVICKESIQFYANKRIALVVDKDPEKRGEPTQYGMIHMFANGDWTFMNPEEFVARFNGEEEGERDRYYRLMDRREIDLFMDYMIDQRKYL